MPHFSIITPLFNKQTYIGETIRSVLAQTLPDWEMIVVDNGSTDNGPEIVRQFSDSRIRQLSCAKKGVSSARNAGLQEAKGEWLVFLDADDLLDPDYLQLQLKSAVNADLVVAPYIEFNEVTGAERTVTAGGSKPTQERLLNSSIVIAPGPTHSFMIQRELMRPELHWPEHLDRLLGEDAVFWFRLINEGRLGVNDVPVARYRMAAPGSRYTTLSQPDLMLEGLGKAINENLMFLSKTGKSPTAGQSETIMRFYAGVYWDARRQKMTDTAEKALKEATHWQKLYFRLQPRPNLGMRARYWLGLPLFSRIFQHG